MQLIPVAVTDTTSDGRVCQYYFNLFPGAIEGKWLVILHKVECDGVLGEVTREAALSGIVALGYEPKFVDWVDVATCHCRRRPEHMSGGAALACSLSYLAHFLPEGKRDAFHSVKVVSENSVEVVIYFERIKKGTVGRAIHRALTSKFKQDIYTVSEPDPGYYYGIGVKIYLVTLKSS